MIKGLACATIWSEDGKKLGSFYGDVLGLKQTFMEGEDPAASEDAGYYTFDGGNGTWIGIGSHSEVKGRASDPHRHMFGLSVDDVKAEHARLKAKGVEFIEEPSDYGDGYWIATLKDPEGNLIQLFQMPG
jgi:predicted enzyme related to lactoylglutathione lyase